MDYRSDVVDLSLCGIVLRIISYIPLKVDEGLGRFRTVELSDVTAHVYPGVLLFPDQLIGSDELMDYAKDGSYLLAAEKNAGRTPAIGARYRSDMSEIQILINFDLCMGQIPWYSGILKVLPLQEILMTYDAVLLHSSRVEIGGKAIVFAAASGTGKTTQAGLWEQYAGARIVSNDRTIVRRIDGCYVTSGFPVDGDAPVLDPTIIPLGVIVLLQQGSVNYAERLNASRALTLLMEQTALHKWDAAGLSQAMLFWSDLLLSHPAILLTCRPDEEAVRCLQAILKETEECGFVPES